MSLKHGPLHDSDDTVREAENSHIRRLFTGSSSASATVPKMLVDKDGLPVIFTANPAPEKKTRPDEISVLWHELLSPLTVIKGYISTLLELDYAITESQKKQYLRGIESASNRVIRLLENLRDITRLEEEDAPVTHPISLLDLINQIVTEVQSQTNKHIIKVVPTSRLPLVRVAPEKIEQVVSNLLGNAVKYSAQGGDIEVEVRLVHSEAELAELYGETPPVRLSCLVVSIADNGNGIPEGEQQQIFERFYRVNSKMVRSTPGAGLGLYICRLIVEAHGGHIWSANRAEGGAVFRFSLPLE
jgi:signal transduction histidine kinase